MSLEAPLATAVEIRVEGRKAGPAEGPRVFRMALHAGESGITLRRPVPFEVGRTVLVRLPFPDGRTLEPLRAEVAIAGDDDDEQGGRRLRFIDLPSAARNEIQAYVAERLSLPPLPGGVR